MKSKRLLSFALTMSILLSTYAASFVPTVSAVNAPIQIESSVLYSATPTKMHFYKADGTSVATTVGSNDIGGQC